MIRRARARAADQQKNLFDAAASADSRDPYPELLGFLSTPQLLPTAA